MASRSSATVFARLRALEREGKRFVPTPLSPLVVPDRSPSHPKQKYVSVEEFADTTGIPPSTVHDLLACKALAHIPANRPDDVRINYSKAVEQLERHELGPRTRVRRTQPLSL